MNSQWEQRPPTKPGYYWHRTYDYNKNKLTGHVHLRHVMNGVGRDYEPGGGLGYYDPEDYFQKVSRKNQCWDCETMTYNNDYPDLDYWAPAVPPKF